MDSFFDSQYEQIFKADNIPHLNHLENYYQNYLHEINKDQSYEKIGLID